MAPRMGPTLVIFISGILSILSTQVYHPSTDVDSGWNSPTSSILPPPPHFSSEAILALQTLITRADDLSFLESLPAPTHSLNPNPQHHHHGGKMGETDDWFRAWLSTLTFDLEDQVIYRFDYMIRLENMTCGDLMYNNVGTAYTGPELPTMEFSITALSFLCNGTYYFENTTMTPPSDSGNGAFIMSIGGTLQDSFQQIILVSPKNTTPPVPGNVSISNCSGSVHVAKVEFSIQPPDGVRDIINNYLSDWISDNQPKMVCRQLGYILKLLTAVMLPLDGVWAALVTHPNLPLPEPPVPAPEIEYFEWADFWPIETLQFLDPMLMNALVNSITNDTGNFTMNLDTWPALKVDTTIAGLNTFNKVRVFANETEPHTIHFDASFDYLDVVIDMELNMRTKRQGRMVLRMNDVRSSMKMFLAVNKSAPDKRYVVQMERPNCLLSLFSRGNITWLSFNSSHTSLNVRSLDADSGHEFDDFYNTYLALLSDYYRDGVSAGIDGFIGGPFRTLMNGLISRALSTAAMELCLPPTNPSPADPVNWMDSKMLKRINMILSHVQPDGRLTVNLIVDTIIYHFYPDGIVQLPDFLPSIESPKLNLTINQMILTGLDSFSDFHPLDPRSPDVLATHLNYAYPSFNITAHVVVATPSISLDSNFTFSLTDINIQALTKLAADHGRFRDLTLHQTGVPSCVASTVTGYALQQFGMSLGEVRILYYFSDEWQEIFETYNISAPSSLWEILEVIWNVHAQRQLSTAHARCHNETLPVPPPPEQSFMDTKFAHVLGGVLVGFALLLSSLWVLYFVVRDPGPKAQVLHTHSEPLVNVAGGATSGSSSSSASNGGCLAGSLFTSHRIPVVVRWLTPLLLLADIGLFFSAHLDIGGKVVGALTFKGEEHIINALDFKFSLGNSVHDMWKAEVYALSLLIAGLSGAWAYAKLVLMLGCWMVPAKRFPPQRRGRLLTVLDATGKWSLIDAFVLVEMMVAFRLHLGVEAAHADIRVEPGWGFFGFLLAAVISLTFSHIILYYHRAEQGWNVDHLDGAIENYSDEYDNERNDNNNNNPHADTQDLLKNNNNGNGGKLVENHDNDNSPRNRNSTRWRNLTEKQAVCTHEFLASGEKNVALDGPRAKSSLKQVGMVVVVVLALALLCVGVFITSFAFEFEGALGLVLGPKATSPFSVWSLGMALPGTTKEPNSFGIRWIQVSYFMFAFFVPLLQLLALLVLWVTPLTLKKQYRLFVLTEMLGAWASLDVYVSAILATMLQIETFAGFMVGDKCDAVNPILHNLLNIDKCFSVGASLSTGCWALFLACVLTLIAGQLIMREAHQALDHRLGKDTL